MTHQGKERQNLISLSQKEHCWRTVRFFPLHRFVDFNLCGSSGCGLANQRKQTGEERRKGSERERGRRVAIENWHGCPWEPKKWWPRHLSFLPLTFQPLFLPSSLPHILPLGQSPRSTSSSVLWPGLLEAAVASSPVGNGGSSKHTSCPSGEALVAKDSMNHFSHTQPTQRSARWQKTEHPSSTSYRLGLSCVVSVSYMCSNTVTIYQCWRFICAKWRDPPSSPWLSTACFNDKWQLPQLILYTSIGPTHTHIYTYTYLHTSSKTLRPVISYRPFSTHFYVSLGFLSPCFYFFCHCSLPIIKLFTYRVTFVLLVGNICHWLLL